MEQKDPVPELGALAVNAPSDGGQSRTRKGLLWSLGGIFLSSTAGLIFIDLLIRPARDTIIFEIAKALLQLGVVAIAGTIVSILVFEYQRSRQNFDRLQEVGRQEVKDKLQREQDDKSYRAEFLKSVANRAVTSYNTVKKCRRLLKAKGIIENKLSQDIQLAAYDEYIEDINDAQLELEALIREIEISADILGNDSILSSNLKKMERFLGKLISEYEKVRPVHAGHQEDLGSFPVLEEFLFPKKPGDAFRVGLARPLQSVQAGIQQELLPASPATPG